ncbi:MAG: monovalent cation/H+ antiporter subunit D family protein [Betaproteobacteria bacterium]|jgi:multicomponent Na+:H+ antiporter subunit D|nr:monovalent cation/H+ antiporter subunit D family protein [Betaproteobacteria bacterium]
MTLSSHFAILVVVVPLVMAPLVAVLPSRSGTPWLVATLTAFVSFLLAIGVTQQVMAQGVLLYELGNWPVPFGIGLVIGPFAALLLLVITGASLGALLWGRASMNQEVGEEHQSLLYACWLLATAGLVGITITGDAFNVFVFMEISALASYVLVSAGPSRQALTATFKYLVTGTIGATFYLIGVGYLYMMTGTLNMADMADRLSQVSDTAPVLMASGFIVLGLALKAALFPMHAWMPNAYRYAPTIVTVFLAACSTKVALFVLIRFDFLILQPNLGDHALLFTTILMPLCIVAFLVGSTVAVFERDLKRMLAYSSVAQIGYILLGASLVSSAGTTAAILHMFNHAIIKAALFMAVGAMVLRYGSSRISDIAGAGKSMPWTMAAFCVAGLSLIGVPLTAGFMSKWFLIQAMLEIEGIGYLVVFLILVSSLLAVVYIWKVIEVAYFQEPASMPQGEPPRLISEAPMPMLLMIWLLAIANIWFGIDPSLPLGLAGMEVQQLLGASR